MSATRRTRHETVPSRHPGLDAGGEASRAWEYVDAITSEDVVTDEWRRFVEMNAAYFRRHDRA